MPRVEAISVCVGYADFLVATLPENLPVLDHMVVITSPEDEETRQVCRKFNVDHVLSEDYKRGGPFNKARMINRVLDQIGGSLNDLVAGKTDIATQRLQISKMAEFCLTQSEKLMTEIADLTAQVAVLATNAADLTTSVSAAAALFTTNAASSVELEAVKAQLVTDTATVKTASDAVGAAVAALTALVPAPAPAA